MYRSHGRLSRATALLFCASLTFFAACSDDNTEGDSRVCPAGEALNPITEQCVAQGRPGEDGGPPSDTADDPDAQTGDDTGSEDASQDGSTPSDAVSCQAGEVNGCSSESAQRICNATGDGYETRACPAGENCVLGECGDRICIPLGQECFDESSTRVCNEDGTAWSEPEPCTDGTVCDRGFCRSTCDLGGKGPSYIGCEYITLDLDQYTDPGTNPKPDEVPHSVVISNPSIRDATVVFTSPSTQASFNIPDPVVPAGEARAFTMPRLDIDESGISDRSIRVVSSEPVIAHQFNPLNNERVFSNDASLLLPVSTLGTEYYAMGWPTQVIPAFPQLGDPDDQQAYVTIVAVETGQTIVQVDATADFIAGPGVSPIAAGSSGSYALRRGQVLNLTANSGTLGGDGNDITGTFIRSTLPVAVFAGHEEAVIGDGSGGDETCCADHLEQQLFPLSTWGSNYIAGLSPERGTKKDHWRIVAGEDGVTLTTNPAQPGANNVQLNAGDSVEFFSAQDFEISATGKIMVGQFLVSQAQTSAGVGDPAFILSVPSTQFREDYTLLTPSGYSRNFVQIIRPAGAAITLDGSTVPGSTFRPVGSGAFEVGHVEIAEGLHTLDADQPFGIQAFGFDNAVSYGYPGGLNLVGEAPNSN